MAVYRNVQTTFWQDAFILDLTPEEKYFYIYLMTNSKTNQIGCYQLPKKVMEIETGYNRETVEKLLERFIAYDKIKYDTETKEILMVNWHKYNWTTSPKVQACIKKELETIKSKAFIEYIHRVCIGYGYGMDTHTQQEKEKEEEKEEEKEQKYDVTSEEYRLTKLLIDLMIKNNANAKVPEDISKWIGNIEKLIRLDKYTVEQVENIIKFSQEDNFWKANILSTSKLRDKAGTLILQMQRTKPQPRNKFLNFDEPEYDWEQIKKDEHEYIERDLDRISKKNNGATVEEMLQARKLAKEKGISYDEALAEVQKGGV